MNDDKLQAGSINLSHFTIDLDNVDVPVKIEHDGSTYNLTIRGGKPVVHPEKNDG